MGLRVDELPRGASARSHALLAEARTIVERCPAEIGAEAFLAGSASRGWADGHSDIELNLIVEPMPGEDCRKEWLRSIGAEPVVPDIDADEAGSLWTIFKIAGKWVEAGWHRPIDLRLAVEGVLKGDPDRNRVAEALTYAVVVRDGPVLSELRDKLATYPDGLGEVIIERELQDWLFPHYLQGRWAPVARRDLLHLTGLLLRDVETVIRLLAAHNRRWEPNAKWLNRIGDDWKARPQNLRRRLRVILGRGSPQARVQADLELIRDTVRLLDPSPRRAEVLKVVSTVLRARV